MLLRLLLSQVRADGPSEPHCAAHNCADFVLQSAAPPELLHLHQRANTPCVRGRQCMAGRSRSPLTLRLCPAARARLVGAPACRNAAAAAAAGLWHFSCAQHACCPVLPSQRLSAASGCPCWAGNAPLGLTCCQWLVTMPPASVCAMSVLRTARHKHSTTAKRRGTSSEADFDTAAVLVQATPRLLPQEIPLPQLLLCG